MLTWHSGAVSYLPNTQWRKLCLAVGFVTLAAACTQDASPLAADAPTTVTSRADRSETDASPSSTAPIQSSTSTVVVPTTATVAPTTTTTVEQRPFGSPSPEWLGTRLLPLRPSDGLGVATPTPAELVDRELWTVDVLEAPASNEFVSSLTTPPPNEVLVRSTWRQECPVGIDELTYGQVSFYGFDGLFHTGEFLVHRDFGEGIVDIFQTLHEVRFPIEEMRVTTQADVDAPRTGDDNNTSSFVCRNAVGSSRWSRHAHGGAIDINPFHNPFVRGDLVLPELASAYIDRTNQRPGMVTPLVVSLFKDLGWGWGGDWSSAKDWQHFSASGT